MNNGIFMKVMVGVHIMLITSAIIGSVVLAQEVAAMSTRIEALAADVADNTERLKYIERNLRFNKP